MKVGPLVDALVESSEPSIRWKTRVHVLGDDPESKAIRALEEEVRRSPRVRALLSRRNELARPEAVPGVYAKWQGAHWVLASLADIGYPAGDKSLHSVRDRVLDFWLDPTYYREFDARTRADAYGREGVPVMRGRYRRCASQQGNALLALTTLGLLDDRGEALVERLLRWQWPDGGWNCDKDPSADSSSFMETLLPMVGLAAYAQDRGSANASRAAERASEVFLRRRLFKRASDGKVIHGDFVTLHYPLYWHYDVLGGLKAMARIGRIGDPRCTEALDLLEKKQRSDGAWNAGRRFYTVSPGAIRAGSDYVDWSGTDGVRMNEWVTAEALGVLRAADRIDL